MSSGHKHKLPCVKIRQVCATEPIGLAAYMKTWGPLYLDKDLRICQCHTKPTCSGLAYFLLKFSLYCFNLGFQVFPCYFLLLFMFWRE